MKVDVEGGEADFLRGARATLTRLRPALVMEVFPDRMAEVLELLGGMGYTQRSGDLGNSNFVFTPSA
jgi:hypothetical protein